MLGVRGPKVLPIIPITIRAEEDKEQNKQQNKDTEQSSMRWSEEKNGGTERLGSCWLFSYLVGVL